MQEILTVGRYTFPYTDLHFPGMNTGEKILFVTRESNVMHTIRMVMVALLTVAFLIIGSLLIRSASSFVPGVMVTEVPLILFGVIICLTGIWWVSETYRKSVFIITTRRLTKIIYTTPFTWYQFSLGLDEIEDTGSYSSSYFEALFGLGYFVARSGAAAIKNFKIVNITFAQDLHNYVNKLLFAFKHHPDKIDVFRPFVPHIKGEQRKELLKNYPQYKTEF